jgi:hypothetical protein
MVEAMTTVVKICGVQAFKETDFDFATVSWAEHAAPATTPAQAREHLLRAGQYRTRAAIMAVAYWETLHLTPQAVLALLRAGQPIPVSEEIKKLIGLMMAEINHAQALVPQIA